VGHLHGFHESGGSSVQEYQSVIDGLTIHAARGAAAAHAARPFEKPNRLAAGHQTSGTGETGNTCSDNDYVCGHERSMPRSGRESLAD
jgi:hypothetical protein